MLKAVVQDGQVGAQFRSLGPQCRHQSAIWQHVGKGLVAGQFFCQFKISYCLDGICILKGCALENQPIQLFGLGHLFDGIWEGEFSRSHSRVEM